MEPFLALSRETWGEEILFDAVKDLPHGRARREGPSAQGAAAPFGFDRGPFSAGRTRLMYAARRRATWRGQSGCWRGARGWS